MSTSADGWPESILDAVDTAFAALTSDPDPLSLDVDTLSFAFNVWLGFSRSAGGLA